MPVKLLTKDNADPSSKLLFNSSRVFALVLSFHIYSRIYFEISICFELLPETFGRLIRNFDSLKGSCFVISLNLASVLVSLT